MLCDICGLEIEHGEFIYDLYDKVHPKWTSGHYNACAHCYSKHKS